MLGSSSNLNEQEVASTERKKLEIYTEQDAEVERQKGYAIPRQYVVLNGDRYYFSQEYIAIPKIKHESEVDRIAQELVASAGMILKYQKNLLLRIQLVWLEWQILMAIYQLTLNIILQSL